MKNLILVIGLLLSLEVAAQHGRRYENDWHRPWHGNHHGHSFFGHGHNHFGFGINLGFGFNVGRNPYWDNYYYPRPIYSYRSAWYTPPPRTTYIIPSTYANIQPSTQVTYIENRPQKPTTNITIINLGGDRNDRNQTYERQTPTYDRRIDFYNTSYDQYGNVVRREYTGYVLRNSKTGAQTERRFD